MTKRELRKDYIGVIVSMLRSGHLNEALKDSLSDEDRERACLVEKELASELSRRYNI